MKYGKDHRFEARLRCGSPEPSCLDDLSADFSGISGRLAHPSGITYRQFRQTLVPRYGRVWLDIAFGYLGFVLIAAGLVLIPKENWVASLALALGGAIGFGYLHHYLALFMHEAAHYNLAPSREANDRLADVFLGVLQAYSVRTYRPSHFGHHREIGSPEDPEHHYFHALDWRMLVLTLSGYRTAREIAQRLASGRSDQDNVPKKDNPSGFNMVFLTGALTHSAIVAAAFTTGHWPLALAWIFGFLVWFPVFSTIRQILEHRDFDADKHTDFSKERHGAITRIFGDGLVARTLGAAGFSRHLLHHWDPLVSYTRLADLERFLLETEVGPIIRARHETYWSAFRKLVA